MVVCGGSAMPRSMIKSFIDMGVQVRHAWGMTEMSPLGTLATLKPPFAELHRRRAARYPADPGLSAVRRRDEDHRRCRQGSCRGTARRSAGSRSAGPAVAKAYFRVDADILDDEGYFDTGDVADHRRSTATCRSPTAPRT